MHTLDSVPNYAHRSCSTSELLPPRSNAFPAKQGANPAIPSVLHISKRAHQRHLSCYVGLLPKAFEPKTTESGWCLHLAKEACRANISSIGPRASRPLRPCRAAAAPSTPVARRVGKHPIQIRMYIYPRDVGLAASAWGGGWVQ